jgi:WD40 repeat protein
MEEYKLRKIYKFSPGGISTDLLSGNVENAHTFLCNICLQILLKPVQCKTCKKEFCNNCITEWQKINNKCPICKHTGFEEIDPETKEELDQLMFNCPYNSIKCQVSMKYSEYLDHIDNCQYGDYESTLIKCNFKGGMEDVMTHIKTCSCNKSIIKSDILIKEFKKGSFCNIEYSNKKWAYNCINALIFIHEYDYLVVGNSKGELVVYDTDLNEKKYHKKGFNYISSLHYLREPNFLLVGTINGGLTGLSMSDMRELFFIKTGHMFVDFIAELSLPIIAVSDREDFVTIVNYVDKEIKNIIKTNEKVNKITSWEEKNLLFAGTCSGAILLFNFIDFSVVHRVENAHTPNKLLHYLEIDKSNNFLISAGYDGYIRKWKIEGTDLNINLTLLFEINTNKKIITGIYYNLATNCLFYLKMDMKVHKVSYSNGEEISSKSLVGTKAACGMVCLPGSSVLIIGDYKTPNLNVIDYETYFD